MHKLETFKFNIYEHPGKLAKIVKVGFSWPAAFFGSLWILSIRKWKLAFVFIVLRMALATAETMCDQFAQGNAQAVAYIILTFAYAALWLTPGFMGNKWRERALISSGYKLQSTITAINKKEALRMYIEDQDAKLQSA